MAVELRRTVTMTLPPRAPQRPMAIAARAVACMLLALVGVIHLVEEPDHGAAAPYLGALFILAAVGSFVAAAGVAAGVRGAWVLGAVIATLTFAGLCVAATVGLPQYSEEFSADLAVPSLVVEGLYLLVYTASAASRRNAAAV